MDGLLNTYHASLINIQSSPSRKCPPPLRRRDDDDATGGKSFNIYRPSLSTSLAPSDPDIRSGCRSIRIRDGTRRFTENIRIRRSPISDGQTNEDTFFLLLIYLFSPVITCRGVPVGPVRISDAGRLVNVQCNLRIRSQPSVASKMQLLNDRWMWACAYMVTDET